MPRSNVAGHFYVGQHGRIKEIAGGMDTIQLEIMGIAAAIGHKMQYGLIKKGKGIVQARCGVGLYPVPHRIGFRV